MLSININQDVEKYRESVLFGLDARDTLVALVTLAGGIGMVCMFHYAVGISMQFSVYLAMPFCMILFLPALKTRDGVSMLEWIKKSRKKRKKLLYQTEKNVKKQSAKQNRKGRGNEKNRKGKKTVQVQKNKK